MTTAGPPPARTAAPRAPAGPPPPERLLRPPGSCRRRGPPPRARIRRTGRAESPVSPRTHGFASESVGFSQPVSLGDDLLHDLVRPGADPRQAGVAPGALDRELSHVAVAAEDLDR